MWYIHDEPLIEKSSDLVKRGIPASQSAGLCNAFDTKISHTNVDTLKSMLLKQDIMGTLDLLGQQKKSLQALYEQYKRRFSENALFWGTLAADEALQASRINGIKIHLNAGNWYLKEGRFNTVSLKTSLEYVKKKIEEARNKQVSQIEAISTALEIEQSLIERNFFEIFGSDSSELKTLLAKLVAAKKAHLSMVHAEWRRLKSQG